MIFSLGLVGPIIAAFTFTDDLAVLGTNVEEISQLLNAEELNHKETPIKLENTGISLRSVSFSYDGTTEVLHDVNLAIHPGTMTALVGPSGSGKSTVAKLIAGYWDVTSGSITLGGHELKDMPLSEIADRFPMYLRTTTCLTAVSGRISAWEDPVPRTQRWSRQPNKAAATPLSASWTTAMIRLSAAPVPIFPAVNASGLPSPAPC